MPQSKWSITLRIIALGFFLLPSVPSSLSAAPEERKILPIVLKLMIVNPSDKLKQTYPLKAYLPEEVKAENVLKKDDLDLSYDADKKAYFVTKLIELKPGETMVKSIEIRDIWRISDKEMQSASDEARELAGKLSGSKYADQGKLLVNNIEVMLLQIFERQNDESVTPEEHISIYRENKQKMRDIDMDLMSLRRLVVASGGSTQGMDFGLNALGEKGNGTGKDLDASLPWMQDEKSAAMMAGRGGAIPAMMAWRIIFGIIGFLGIMSGMSLFIWQKQIQFSGRNRRKETAKGKETLEIRKPGDSVSLADLLAPSTGESTKSPDGQAA